MIILAATLAVLSVPAMAQSGWTANNYGNPNGMTYYNGTGGNQGWNGTANNYGNPSGPTYYDFNGPNGQHQSCTSTNYGNPMGQTYTNCN